jgi:hypothetical protein
MVVRDVYGGVLDRILKSVMRGAASSSLTRSWRWSGRTLVDQLIISTLKGTVNPGSIVHAASPSACGA